MDSVVERNLGLMSAPVNEDLVFLNPKTNCYVAFDAVGRRVWELLENSRRASEVAADLAAEFDGPPAQMVADVQSFLDELEREGMVSVVERPSS
jgi:hypothetical protein